MPRFPKPTLPPDYALTLARMVAATSWLPHPEAVKALGGAVFFRPCERGKASSLLPCDRERSTIGMYDDKRHSSLGAAVGA